MRTSARFLSSSAQFFTNPKFSVCSLDEANTRELSCVYFFDRMSEVLRGGTGSMILVNVTTLSFRYGMIRFEDETI